MIYGVRRFSYQEVLKDGSEYIYGGLDSGLEGLENVSTKILEDTRISELRPVKRKVGMIKNLSKLLRRKKKEKSKKYSDQDPTTTINTSEATKFKTALGRLSNTMGSDSQSIIK